MTADDDLYPAWLARENAGHHEQNVQILERLLAARPEAPELHLLLAQTLLAMDRYPDCLSAVYRAIDLGENDASILMRALTVCRGAGDLVGARQCIDRAKRVAPRGFPLKKELREQDRYLKRQEKDQARGEHLSSSFDKEPRDWRVAADLARYQIRTGHTYAAYYVVARALHYNPEVGRLRRLERKLSKIVPSDECAEARRWAASGEPRTVSYRRPVRGYGGHRKDGSEAEQRQAGR